ncbi:hypothetical protein ROLI_004090 [Roseobacter fucihabitans]|uniref:Uncharacterized protein n=1 Tax=Roseobacter fucihabitans TaxID=1537242 RepID=A0ABZ2BMT8_9RHOB|nr:hypothetical protein [Roseobacter litoralis]MBC6963659.1 hypothetical protein [Roseobacter litoralis]
MLSAVQANAFAIRGSLARQDIIPLRSRDNTTGNAIGQMPLRDFLTHSVTNLHHTLTGRQIWQEARKELAQRPRIHIDRGQNNALFCA